MTVSLIWVNFNFLPKNLTFNSFPHNKFWTLPKRRSFEITILKLMKMPERVENNIEKGGIVRYE